MTNNKLPKALVKKFDAMDRRARLMAAAPEMYEELRTLIGFIDYHDLAKNNKRLEVKLLGARAALAKVDAP